MEIENSSYTKIVLISYSHDDPDHMEWVKNLADKLRSNGVDVILDQYDLLPGDSLTRFMEDVILNANKIILVLTPAYKLKADNRKGGAGYEYALVSLEHYRSQLSRKSIPIIRRGDWENACPDFVKTLFSIDMTKDAEFEEKFRILLHAIFDRSLLQKPKLGQAPKFDSGASKAVVTADEGEIRSSTPLLRRRVDVLRAPGAGNVSEDVIEPGPEMKRFSLSYFSKWTFQLHIPVLERKMAYDLQRMMTDAALRVVGGLHRYPIIFNDNFRKTHKPVFRYEQPLQVGMESNLLESEVLLIDSGVIHYEYCELTNMDPMIAHLTTPLTTLLYLLYTLRGVSIQHPVIVFASLAFKFSSNRPAFFNLNSSPVRPPGVYGHQTMGIFSNPEPNRSTIILRDDQSFFEAFQRIYRQFEAQNPQARRPILDIERRPYNELVSALGLSPN